MISEMFFEIPAFSKKGQPPGGSDSPKVANPAQDDFGNALWKAISDITHYHLLHQTMKCTLGGASILGAFSFRRLDFRNDLWKFVIHGIWKWCLELDFEALVSNITGVQVYWETEQLQSSQAQLKSAMSWNSWNAATSKGWGFMYRRYCRVPEGRGLHQSPPDLYGQRQDTVPKPFRCAKHA